MAHLGHHKARGHPLSTYAKFSEKLTYQGFTNVSFSENFAYVLNGWPPIQSQWNHAFILAPFYKYLQLLCSSIRWIVLTDLFIFTPASNFCYFRSTNKVVFRSTNKVLIIVRFGYYIEIAENSKTDTKYIIVASPKDLFLDHFCFQYILTTCQMHLVYQIQLCSPMILAFSLTIRTLNTSLQL